LQTIHKLNTTQKKQTTQNTAKQNYPGSVAFYNTRAWTRGGLILQMLPSTLRYYGKFVPICGLLITLSLLQSSGQELQCDQVGCGEWRGVQGLEVGKTRPCCAQL